MKIGLIDVDGHKLQRWVNSRVAFAAVERFEDFK